MVKEFCRKIPYGNNQTKYKEGHVNINRQEKIKYNNNTDWEKNINVEK